MTVTADITMSLDGFVTGPDAGPEAGLGRDGEALHDWVMHADDVDRAILREGTARSGAVIMGRNLFDVIDGPDGNDPAIRPNQVFAISLDHPILDRERWPAVLDTVRRRLLTHVGLRTLSADHPDYKSHYRGDLRARDAAYHQGTVWPWLIGHYVDAILRVNPDRAAARRVLHGFRDHLSEAGIGSISEIFDAEDPYAPGGCIAQAWSVAEVLRAWVKTRST